jgi:hypothetical protein
MPFFADRVQVATATIGTGTVTLGAAAAGYRTFAAAAVPNGAEVSYLITDGPAWEIGSGTYSSAGPTLSRTLSSSSTGALLNLSGSASVSIAVRAADLSALVVPGSVRLADGSATAPTLSFTADSDTGFYRSGANRISASANGKDALWVDPTGLYVWGATEATVSVVSAAGYHTPGLFLFGNGGANYGSLQAAGGPTGPTRLMVNSPANVPIAMRVGTVEKVLFQANRMTAQTGYPIVWSGDIQTITSDKYTSIANDHEGALEARTDLLGLTTFATPMSGGRILLSQSGAVPSAAEQIIGHIDFTGKYDGGGDNPYPGFIWGVSAGAWSPGSTPFDFVFSTCPAGSVGSFEHFRITGTGAKATGTFSATESVAAPKMLQGNAAMPDELTPGALGSPPFFKGGRYKAIRSSSLASATTDLYTVPPGRKASVLGTWIFNPTAGAITFAAQAKIGGVNYALTPPTGSIAANAVANTGQQIILDAGESYSIMAATAGLNVWLRIVEFDDSSYWKSARLLTLAAGANTLYTVPAGKVAFPSSTSFNLGSASAIIGAVNLSGGARSLTPHGTAPGSTAVGTGTQSGPASVALANNAAASLFAPVMMGATESLVINADSAGAVFAWVNVYEVPA